MNHKRGRPKNRRAGCLMCKPHKMNGFNADAIVGSSKHGGFNRIRDYAIAKQELSLGGGGGF